MGRYKTDTIKERYAHVDGRAAIHGPADVAKLLREEMSEFIEREQESFWVVLLTTKNTVKKIALVSIGTLNASIVHPREILKPAIRESAASFILGHNHPSGDPKPSKEDVEFTRRMDKAGELLGITLLDHVVIGAGETFYSLKESGVF